MSTLIQTFDHTLIQKWAEERKGQPAVQNASTNDNVIGVLRIKFPDDTDQLRVISWEEFFQEFDENEIMFLYNDEPENRYNKFVYQGTASHTL